MANNTSSNNRQVHLLEVIGRIDGSKPLILAGALEKALAQGRSQLILDLSRVEYMNSAGLRELFQLLQYIRKNGGILKIANPAERVKKLLEMVGLDTVIEIYFDSALGLASHPRAGEFAVAREICYYV
ncbi:MAG: STAS domain-containing protein [Chloroflexi bacterium]|nr:STAS domain-containing protein [Chloroflexota bacterium]